MSNQCAKPLKTKGCHFDNFVITGGTVSCHYNCATSDDKVVKLTIFCFQWCDTSVLIIFFRLWQAHITTMAHFSSQWRHNGHEGVSNHQPHGCLLNHLFRPRSTKTSKLHFTGLYEGNSLVTGSLIHWWPVNSPHKGPAIRKCFHLMISSWDVFSLTIENFSSSCLTNNFEDDRVCQQFPSCYSLWKILAITWPHGYVASVHYFGPNRPFPPVIDWFVWSRPPAPLNNPLVWLIFD